MNTLAPTFIANISTTCLAFKKNYTACQKARKTQSKEKKQESESDLGIAQMLELSEFNITMINKLKTKGKSRQHARTDE